MLLYRREVTIDAETRRIVVRQTCLGIGPAGSYPLASFRKI